MKRSKNRKGTSGSSSLQILSGFGWFCGFENREHIQLVTADLRRDRREMKQKNYGNAFVYCVISWKVVGTICPIMRDGTIRFFTALLPIGKLIARFKLVK